MSGLVFRRRRKWGAAQWLTGKIEVDVGKTVGQMRSIVTTMNSQPDVRVSRERTAKYLPACSSSAGAWTLSKSQLAMRTWGLAWTPRLSSSLSSSSGFATERNKVMHDTKPAERNWLKDPWWWGMVAAAMLVWAGLHWLLD